MKKTLLLVVVTSMLLGPFAVSQVQAQGILDPCPTTEIKPEKQGDNLLINPGFEWPYYYLWQEPGVGNGCIPSGWVHWYTLLEGDGRGDYFVPEWKPVQSQLEPLGVFEGGSSVAYYKPWAYHLAGMYQEVQVPANATLEFAAYGMAWSTDEENPVKYDSSGAPNPVPMSIGIDPNGGTNPFAEEIVWSSLKAPLDVFERFSVTATAEGSTVTVFLWSHNGLYESNLPVQWIDVFWDASSLRVVGGEGASPTSVPSADDDTDDGEAEPTAASPGADSLEGVTPAQTQPPRDDGSQWHIVQEGEALLRIAAAYGVDAQTIRNLNNLTSDTLFINQELLIKPAGETDEDTAEDDGEDANADEEAPAEEEAEAELGQICMVVFDDLDTNGEWGQGEPTVAGATVNLSGQQSDTYTTQDASEPFCLSELAAGDYTVEVVPPEGYALAGASSSPVAVTVSEGGDVALDVPLSAQAESTPTPEPTAPAVEAESTSRQGPSPLVLGLVIAGAGMIITSVVTTIIITRQAR